MIVPPTSFAVPFAFDSPSPDDQVLAARQRGTGTAKKLPPPSPPSARIPSGKGPTLVQAPKSAPKPYDPIRNRRQSAPAVGLERAPAQQEEIGVQTRQSEKQSPERSVGELRRMSLDDQDSDRGQGEPSSSGRGDASSRSNPPLGKSKRTSLPLSSYKPDEELLSEIRSQGGGKDVLNLIIVGHVDAGKSTLMGRVLHALGQVSQKEMHRNEKQSKEQGKGSFAYAWVLDEGSEERARGVTMTVAVAHFETPHRRVVLLDAPGHKDFVPNMISGASQADAAVLVVDATPGGFEAGMEGQGGQGGQTKEHAQLARSLGVEQLIVAVNKMDAIGFDEERFAEIQAGLAPFLRQCGFKDSAVRWLPVSGLAGENLTEPPTAKELVRWYKGPHLLSAVDSFQAPVRLVDKPLRLVVAEVFKNRTLGSAAVGGKLEGGALKQGTKVLVMPAGELATVKAVEQNGEAKSGASAGDSVDVGLVGIEPNVLFAGSVICHPEYPVPTATRMEVRLLTLNIVMPLLRGTSLVLHAHSAKQPVRISELVSLLDPKSGQVARAKPRVVTKNQSAVVELVSERAICLEAYTDYRALGRIALRDGGRTVAVGIVTKFLEM